MRVGDDAQKRFFLIGAKGGEPKDGYGLVVIMPGGDGGADFHPFVKRIVKHAFPEGYLAAQPIAVKWTDTQQIVWPTAKSRVAKQKFGTEEFVHAIIAEVEKRNKINAERVFTLAWSSSGPAAYAIALQPKTPVKGSFIAMSVFNRDHLPPLIYAKARAFYIYHSPEDRVCPIHMARDAAQILTQHGAMTQFREYQGGHGWHGPMYEDIRAGIAWLEQNAGRVPADFKTAPATKLEAGPARNGGFEKGVIGWIIGNNSKKMEKQFTIPPSATKAAVQFWMVLDGTVWLDDVRLEDAGRG